MCRDMSLRVAPLAANDAAEQCRAANEDILAVWRLSSRREQQHRVVVIISRLAVANWLQREQID